MAGTDPRIDAYIAKSAAFAKPILGHLRALVHAGCPEVEETIKWGAPHFMHNGMLCMMAAFKEHCAFGFWNGALIIPENAGGKKNAMGHLGRLTSLDDLPADRTIVGYVKKAARLNETGVKKPMTPRRPKGAIVVPDALQAALVKRPKARAAFDKLSPSHRREYAEWIAEAKSDDTRKKRVASAIEWIADGKSRNWKYEPRKAAASA